MSRSKSRSKNRRPAASRTAERAREAGAKEPQDHAAKAEATGGTYTVHVAGLALDVEYDALNDYRVIEAADRGRPTPMFDAIVGDRHDEVLDALEDENGRVPVERVRDFVEEVYRQVGREQGNSLASPAS